MLAVSRSWLTVNIRSRAGVFLTLRSYTSGTANRVRVVSVVSPALDVLRVVIVARVDLCFRHPARILETASTGVSRSPISERTDRVEIQLAA